MKIRENIRKVIIVWGIVAIVVMAVGFIITVIITAVISTPRVVTTSYGIEAGQGYANGEFTIHDTESKIIEGTPLKMVVVKRKKDGKLFPFIVNASYKTPKEGTEVELVSIDVHGTDSRTGHLDPGFFRFWTLKTHFASKEELGEPNPLF